MLSKKIMEKTFNQYFEEGNKYSDQKEYLKAQQAYNKALNINEKSIEAHYNLGLTYQNSLQYQKAVQHYLIVVKLNPKDSKAYQNLGIVYRNLNKYPESVKSLQKSLDLNPKSNNAHYQLGFTFLDFEKFEEAKEQFKNSLKLNPQSGFSYYGLGKSFLRLQNYELAIKQYILAIQLCPWHISSHNEIALAYFNLFNYKKMIQYLQKAVKVNPNQLLCKVNLAYGYLAFGKIQVFYQILQQVRELFKTQKIQQLLLKEYSNNLISYFEVTLLLSNFMKQKRDSYKYHRQMTQKINMNLVQIHKPLLNFFSSVVNYCQKINQPSYTFQKQKDQAITQINLKFHMLQTNTLQSSSEEFIKKMERKINQKRFSLNAKNNSPQNVRVVLQKEEDLVNFVQGLIEKLDEKKGTIKELEVKLERSNNALTTLQNQLLQVKDESIFCSQASAEQRVNQDFE